jgi:hypothetical protein
MDAMTPPEMMQGDPQAMMSQALVPQPKPVTHDVTILTTKKHAQAKVMGVPPEEFGIERGARTIKDCNYCFHETTQTVGALTAQGYDPNQLKGLAKDSDSGTETLSRDTVDEDIISRDTLNESARPIRVTEHYIRMDYEGNGKTCIYKVTTGGEGGDILRKRDGDDEKYEEDIERVDCYPFAAASPVPVTHRFFGRSIADLVMDIQRIKTALVRGMLDNLYLHNNPRVVVNEGGAGPNTLDDLLVSRPGGIVRTKSDTAVQWQVVPDITGSVYPALQYLDATRETRTGLSQQSQGIDANALQNQSATAVAQVFSASQMRSKLIARILAEGIRDMFSLLHATIRKHGQQGQTVRLRNNWVQVDPRQWKTRNDMTINVGLGTGGKAQQFAQVMALANVQKEMIAGGKVNLVDDQALFNTASELTKIMGYKNPDKFFNDPSAKDPKTGQPMHPPPPPPVPESVQVAQIKAETDKEKMGVQAQLDQQADERKAQIESVQAQADMATEREKLQGEMALAQQKFELERELKLMDFQLKREMHQQELAQRAEQHRQQMEAGVFKTVQGQETHEQKLELADKAAKAKPKGDK